MENKNKIIIGLGAVALLLLGIVFGSAGSKSTSSSDSGSSSGGGSSLVDPAPSMSDDEIYLTSLRASGNVYLLNADDSLLLETGQTVCDTLDEGYTVEQIAAYLVANADTTDPDFFEMEGLVIGAAITVYCPEYTSLIP